MPTIAPQTLAQNLGTFIDRLGLKKLTLVVHDLGVRSGFLMRSSDQKTSGRFCSLDAWLWSLRGTPAERVSRFMAGPVGRWLYTRANLSPRVLMKAAFGEKRTLSRDVHRHYIAPFPNSSTRTAPWRLATELLRSSDWFESLWMQREQIADLPALVLWGMKDPAFTPSDLERWKSVLRNARFVEFPRAGHFCAEAPAAAIREIRAFLHDTDRFMLGTS